MSRLQSLAIVLLAVVVPGCAGAARGSTSAGPAPAASAATPSVVRLEFVAASDTFAAAVAEYQAIWAAESSRMVAALERGSGLSFRNPEYADTAITAIVIEQASNSGYRDLPMRMRASYSAETKRATLLHELGHRLMSNLFRKEEEPHPHLFLWLYDVWTDLYGSDFADRQVAIEKARRGVYPEAWNWALARSRAERAAAWQAIVAERSAR